MSFTPYYDSDIQETIDNQSMHEMVEMIKSANMQALDDYHQDMVTECTIDPSFERSKVCRVAAKAIARGIQRCRYRGEYLIKDIGPPVTAWGIIASAMEGYIIGDEFARRWSGDTSDTRVLPLG